MNRYAYLEFTPKYVVISYIVDFFKGENGTFFKLSQQHLKMSTKVICISGFDLSTTKLLFEKQK